MNGDEIRRKREARGLTQEQLAAHLGVGQRTVGNWERGHSVPLNRMGMLEAFFAAGEVSDADPLRTASETALLAELLRRASLRERSTATA